MSASRWSPPTASTCPRSPKQILADGDADMVSMARPLLADPDWVAKAAPAQPTSINTCIACNQACLDHIFENQPRHLPGQSARLPRDRAALHSDPHSRKRIAVVGAGPAGLACATTRPSAATRSPCSRPAGEIGGQFNMAKRIPGKEEFDETLRYFRRRLDDTACELRLAQPRRRRSLRAASTRSSSPPASRPRVPDIPGVDHPKVVELPRCPARQAPVGERVAIIGAGGIGFDVAEFLTQDSRHRRPPIRALVAEWGVDPTLSQRGGLAAPRSPNRRRARSGCCSAHRQARQARWARPPAGSIAPRSGEARADARRRQLRAHRRRGLHVTVDGEPQLLEVDNVVVCAGQEPRRDLHDELQAAGRRRAPDRRRRRRRRTGRQAGDRPGHAARRRAVEGMSAGRSQAALFRTATRLLLAGARASA